MGKKNIVHGCFLISDGETTIPEGAVCFEGDTILAVGTRAELEEQYPDAVVSGGPDLLVIPGLINGHSHGKGITDFQRGQLDDTLETWKWRSFPPVDPYLDALWFTCRLIESGVTSTMVNAHVAHCSRPLDEALLLFEAYSQSGIRVSFSPVLANKNHFVYGDNDAFINGLPGKLNMLCRKILRESSAFNPNDYFELHNQLAAETEGTSISVFHGPLAPQWVDDATLERIAGDSRDRGVGIHIHLQQTQLQNLYGYRTYGTSLLRHLDSIGFLSDRVTCGHCVWISEDDIKLLADTGASVTHHPSCNLRIRNGIAPVYQLVNKGVIVALGMDDKDFNDSRNFLEEMRLASKLHRLSSHRLDSDHLTPKDIFRFATVNGAAVLGMSGETGKLQPGMKADIVCLDWKKITEPYTCELHSAIDALIYRGKSEHVRTVIIGGKTVLDEGRLTFCSREALLQELSAAVPSDYARQFTDSNKPFPLLRKEIENYYKTWHDEIEKKPQSPYYSVN